MLVALGLLAGSHGETVDAPVLSGLLGAPQPVVRWAAAIALARLFVHDPPEPAVRELLRWGTGEVGHRQRLGTRIRFNHGELGRYALLAAVRPGAAARRRAVEALLARLPVVSVEQGGAELLVWDLLRVAFDDDALLGRRPFGQLSPLQQRVLRVLADSDQVWQPARNGRIPPWNALLDHGLPETRQRLQTYTRP